MQALKDWISNNFIIWNYMEYDGLCDLSVAELLVLKGYVEASIFSQQARPHLGE